MRKTRWEDLHGCNVIDCSDIKGTNCYCDDAAREQILKRLTETDIAPRGIRFLGSGNYHYVSYLTTSLITEPYILVVIDHHPDMRAPQFAGLLSCGGWVREVLLNQPLCKMAVLIGVDEGLFQEEYHALPKEAAENVYKEIPAEAGDLPVFLSVDLDVLDEQEYETNWDQGEMTLDELRAVIRSTCEGRRIIGVDICGAKDG